MRMILGREPALWTGAVVAVLSALATFNIPGLSAGQAFAVGGLVTAAITAATTRPIGPGLFTGLLTALVAVMAEYGTRLPESQVAVLSAVVLREADTLAPPRHSGVRCDRLARRQAAGHPKRPPDGLRSVWGALFLYNGAIRVGGRRGDSVGNMYRWRLCRGGPLTRALSASLQLSLRARNSARQGSPHRRARALAYRR